MGTTWKDTENILTNVDGTLDVSDRGWCSWRDRIISRCILEVHTTGFANKFDVEYEKKREENYCFKIVGLRPLEMDFPFTEIGKIM